LNLLSKALTVRERWEELFFFEKKNQKTFPRWAVPAASPLRENRREVFFSSFSSEKEGLFSIFLHMLA
jgi:hypothetical protein